jgi:hypothetical protein
MRIDKHKKLQRGKSILELESFQFYPIIHTQIIVILIIKNRIVQRTYSIYVCDPLQHEENKRSLLKYISWLVMTIILVIYRKTW